jgi:hypothetical protein
MSQTAAQSINHNRLPGKPVKPGATSRCIPGDQVLAKKVRGLFHYLGKIADGPHGRPALDLWCELQNDLLAARDSHMFDDGLTIREIKRYPVDTCQIVQWHIARRCRINEICGYN